MENKQTIEKSFESVEETNARTVQNIDKNVILQLIQQLLRLLASILQSEINQEQNKNSLEKIPPPPEIIDPTAPFCEPKDPEIQRAEIAKGAEKIEEKSHDEQEKAPQRQRTRSKSQGLTR